MTHSTSALAAKAIKAELKSTFPQIKFSVKSSNFAGGNAVDVAYTDGVPSSEVQKVVGKYQYGSFDGMTDCYEYTNSREDIPQAKYVQVRRTISPEVRQMVKEQIAKDYGMKDMNNDQEWMSMFRSWPEQVIYRETEKRSF